MARLVWEEGAPMVQKNCEKPRAICKGLQQLLLTELSRSIASIVEIFLTKMRFKLIVESGGKKRVFTVGDFEATKDREGEIELILNQIGDNE